MRHRVEFTPAAAPAPFGRPGRVATTTVREALIRLEANRVIEIHHGTGVVVSAA